MSSCRFCGSILRETFIDLGKTPLANSYLTASELNKMEPFYPLHLYVCSQCFLVQLEEYESPDHIFSDYAYFSSYSDSWLQHCEAYVKMVVQRFRLNSQSRVIEIASNDGYLLQFFVVKKIPVLGIEPASNVAEAARKNGISTLVEFFGEKTARQLVSKGMTADLLIGNNVLAHVPSLNDFVQGMKLVLKPQGIITMEFPHLMRLMEQNQFDTIYHEHFSYFSFTTAQEIFASHGLTLFDVQELSTHGGSLRIYACHSEDASRPVSERVRDLRACEEAAGFRRIEHYLSFGDRVKEAKYKLLNFLISAKREGKTVAAYGAPAKANTLLNYCGIRSDLIEYTVDRSPHKQANFLPGTHIPIYNPSKIRETRPDYVIVLPWNLKEEIMEQMDYIGEWGGRFVIPIPEVKVYPEPEISMDSKEEKTVEHF